MYSAGECAANSIACSTTIGSALRGASWRKAGRGRPSVAANIGWPLPCRPGRLAGLRKVSGLHGEARNRRKLNGSSLLRGTDIDKDGWRH